MAEALLRLDLPHRIDLAIELLAPGKAPLAIAEAVATVGQREPEHLNGRLVEPLLGLLGSDDPFLSAGAATALAAFRDAGVVTRLGTLAGNAAQPIQQRLAAVDALALNSERRDVVGELIELLSSSEPAVVSRVVESLQSVSRVDYRRDVEAWRVWWDAKEQLTDADWLRDRLDLAVRQNQSLRTELNGWRKRHETTHAVTSERIAVLLRQVYQLSPQQARDALLRQWLADDLEAYRLGAMRLVREQVSEGKPPGDEVRRAIMDCFSDPSAPVRTAALQIIGGLQVPADAPEVLRLLISENDPIARQTALRVLGRLGNPVALESLIAEIGAPDTPTDCVREAAIALGVLYSAAKVDSASVKTAIEPLRSRFSAAAADDVRLKEALLSAMAQIGEPAFAPEFDAYLSSEWPELVLAAIRGIEVIGATDQLDRLMAHLSHADARVRQLACIAVGKLGSEPAHLEALVGRLNPDVEVNEGVRDAAWASFRVLLNKQKSTDRPHWISRLSHRPDRQIALYEELIAKLAASGNGGGETLNEARRDLADVLLSQSRFAEAFPHVQELWRASESGEPATRRVAGLNLVRAGMGGERLDRVRALIESVCGAVDSDEGFRQQMTDIVLARFETEDAAERSSLVTLAGELAGVSPDCFAADWSERLGKVVERLADAPQPVP